MCVVSMVMDHYQDKWKPLLSTSPLAPLSATPPITAAEIEEFRRLLERAREYDRRHGQPDCELDEKKENLRRLAKYLGVEIAFL
jgi:hypothetical protein